MKRTLTFSVLALAAVCILWACSSETPKQIAEKYLTAMSVGDYEAAKQYVTKDSQSALDTYAKDPASKIEEAIKMQIGDETLSENKAMVAYKQNADDKVLQLTKEDGKWKAIFSESDFVNRAKQVGESFLLAFAKGDIELAKTYATKDAQTSLDMMAYSTEAKRGNPDKIKIGSIDLRGDQATLSYTENGAPKTLDLVKEAGEWKAAWTKGGNNNEVQRNMGNDPEQATYYEDEE